MWQVGLRISWLTQGLPTLSWPPAPEPSPHKPVPFWVLQEKQLQKYSPEHFFVAGMGKYFPTSFWWSLSVLLPFWEETRLCLWNLAAIPVQIEDALKLSLGGELFLPATKWNNSWMGKAIYGCLIKGSSDIKYCCWWKIQAWLYPLDRFLTQLPSCLPPRALSSFTLA